MKKLLIIAACAMLGSAVNAAAVGWTLATGSTTYGNDAYQFFVIGQNGATSIATITGLLDAGSSTASYAFGAGKTAANGSASVTFGTSGKSLDAGTYESFFVLFDSDAPVAGSAKYVVVSGPATLTKTIGTSTASVTFTSGNVSSIVGNASNWQTYGAPEPTSGLLLLLGVAGLALKRKCA